MALQGGAQPALDLARQSARQRAGHLRLAEQTRAMTENGDQLDGLERREACQRAMAGLHELPQGAQIWSLTVNGRPTVPSSRKDAQGEPIHLLPLPQASSGEMAVAIDFIYVSGAPPTWRPGRQRFTGPRFDLPLKNVRWTLYLPEGYAYDDFEGTLAVDESLMHTEHVEHYGIGDYESEVVRVNDANQRLAAKLLKEGSEQVHRGQHRAARQALESAWHVSLSDSDLNEDARVQLNELIQQQALVGLLGSRGRLRRQLGDEAGGRPVAAPLVTEHYNQQDVDRLTNSLNKLDSDNLGRITARIVQLQSAAAAAAPQLVVTMPVRGRMIAFNRPIQMNSDADMIVAFSATPLMPERSKRSFVWLGGLCAVLAILLSAAPAAGRRWNAWNETLARGASQVAADEERSDLVVDNAADVSDDAP